MSAKYTVRIVWQYDSGREEIEHINVNTYEAAKALAATTVPNKRCIQFVIIDLDKGHEIHPVVNGIAK